MRKVKRQKYLYDDGALIIIGKRDSWLKLSLYKAGSTIWFRIFGFGLYFSWQHKKVKILI